MSGDPGLVRAAVSVLFSRVMNDPLLRPIFEQVDVEEIRNDQRAFMSMVLGGPDVLVGGTLARLDISDEAYDAIADHVRLTLYDIGLGTDAVADVERALEDLRPSIVTPLSAASAPPGP